MDHWERYQPFLPCPFLGPQTPYNLVCRSSFASSSLWRASSRPAHTTQHCPLPNISVVCLFWGRHHSRWVQDILLILCSETTTDRAQGTIWGVRNQTQAGGMEDKRPPCFLSSSTGDRTHFCSHLQLLPLSSPFALTPWQSLTSTSVSQSLILYLVGVQQETGMVMGDRHSR